MPNGNSDDDDQNDKHPKKESSIVPSKPSQFAYDPNTWQAKLQALLFANWYGGLGFVDTAKQLSYESARFNAFFEIAEKALHRFAEISPDYLFRSAAFYKAMSGAAFAAAFGGVSGLVYPTTKMVKSFRSGEWPSFDDSLLFTGGILFGYEGYLLYKSFLSLSDPHRRHAMHRQIGIVGSMADASKAIYYYKNDDPKNAIMYGLLSAANLRSAYPQKITIPLRIPRSPRTLLVPVPGFMSLAGAALISSLLPDDFYRALFPTSGKKKH